MNFIKKINSIKNPTKHYGNITLTVNIIMCLLFLTTFIYQIIIYFIFKNKFDNNEKLSENMEKNIKIINNFLFITYIISIIIPCLFILYMKQDYIFNRENKFQHNSKDNSKNYRLLKNQVYVDNVIWWTILYIFLFFIFMLIERYIFLPKVVQIFLPF